MLLRDALVGGVRLGRAAESADGMRGLAVEAGPALTQVPMWSPCSGAHRF